MNRPFITLFALLAALSAQAAEPWSVERCMEYAAEHSHTVRLQQYDLDASRTERIRAIGAFLPEVYGSVGAQMNFGRAIDPETNTYTDVNTFYNGYGLQASLVSSTDCSVITNCAWLAPMWLWGARRCRQRKMLCV